MSDFHRLFLLWDGPNFHPVTKPTSTPIPLPPSSRSSRSESTGHSQTNNVAIPVAVNAFSRYRGVVSAFVLVIPDPTHLLPMYLHQHAWKGCVIRICSPIDTSPFVETLPGTLIHTPLSSFKPTSKNLIKSIPIYRLTLRPELTHFDILEDSHPFSVGLKYVISRAGHLKGLSMNPLEAQRILRGEQTLRRVTKGEPGGLLKDPSRPMVSGRSAIAIDRKRFEALLRVVAESKDGALLAAVVGAAVTNVYTEK